MADTRLRFLQLPVPPPSAYATTGNVPLAAATLAVALDTVSNGAWDTGIIGPEATDGDSDTALVERILGEDPDYLGLSLYLWNTERSLHIAREVKKRSPKTTILIGGPEVNADNEFLREQEGYDIAVSGEGEGVLYQIIEALENNKGNTLNSKNSKAEVRSENLQDLWDFPQSRYPAENFLLNRFPSPYTTKHLKVEPQRSVYIETVRGCRSQCAYCFYPKSSTELRSLSPTDTQAVLETLRTQGARDLVFLDPTFNHRPNFSEFLDVLIQANTHSQMGMFAELRSEGLTADIASKLAQAGFRKIELGMQSINPETLKRVQRFGNPLKVAEAAKLLVGEGIELLLDLIIGLPGDTPDDVLRGIEFFQNHGLEEWVQVFPLSVLPGTQLRKTAERDGVRFSPLPPYRVQSTPGFTEIQLWETLETAEEALGVRIDDFPRPNLIKPDGQSSLRFNLSDSDPIGGLLTEREHTNPTGTKYRHTTVWLENLFRKEARDAPAHAHRAIPTWIAENPYTHWDIAVLWDESWDWNSSCAHWFQKTSLLLDSLSPSYSTGVLAHRGENLLRKLILVLPEGREDSRTHPWSLPPNMSLKALEAKGVRVYRNARWQSRFADVQWGIDLPSLRLTDSEFSDSNWSQIQHNLDPEAVSFAEPRWEKQWTREVLGY